MKLRIATSSIAIIGSMFLLSACVPQVPTVPTTPTAPQTTTTTAPTTTTTAPTTTTTAKPNSRLQVLAQVACGFQGMQGPGVVSPRIIISTVDEGKLKIQSFYTPLDVTSNVLPANDPTLIAIKNLGYAESIEVDRLKLNGSIYFTYQNPLGKPGETLTFTAYSPTTGAISFQNVFAASYKDGFGSVTASDFGTFHTSKFYGVDQDANPSSMTYQELDTSGFSTNNNVAVDLLYNFKLQGQGEIKGTHTATDYGTNQHIKALSISKRDGVSCEALSYFEHISD